MIRVSFCAGIKESDTGLAAPSQWDLVSDKQAMQEEQPLQVGVMDARRRVKRCQLLLTNRKGRVCMTG